jgi:hypothetical protein
MWVDLELNRGTGSVISKSPTIAQKSQFKLLEFVKQNHHVLTNNHEGMAIQETSRATGKDN